MNEIFSFLKTYYREIVEVVIFIASVVICLIRKRPCINEMDSIKKDILEKLPGWISFAEDSRATGSSKKSYVVGLCSSYVKKVYNVEFSVLLANFVSEAIEDVLSTPQKKGE